MAQASERKKTKSKDWHDDLIRRGDALQAIRNLDAEANKVDAWAAVGKVPKVKDGDVL